MRIPPLRLALLALTFSSVAACNLQNSPLLISLFGPPKHELVEAYAGTGTGATVDHSAFDALLAEHVHGYDVDYDGLSADSAALDAYLSTLATAPFDQLDRDGKLALLINAYNAFTLRLILDHRSTSGSLASIQDIPRDERWDAERWTLAGQTTSLTSIEHDELRAKFVEPRIHFAINCASTGCPPLRSEAYTPARLEEQLADQMHTIHHDERWLRIDGDTVYLSKLYLWYAGDFEQVAGSSLAFAAQERPELGSGEWTIEWLDYDWSLNDDVEAP